ncbi:MAG: sugar transport system permease protein [Verrucomicrobia bacterium]|nr:sugar transport system permease protein [Verrucomicrobiota bacterium]
MRANEPKASALHRRDGFRRVWVYALLLGGAVIFAWPLVWMFLTSLKTEREISSETGSPLPEAPQPRAVSPYIDSTWFSAPATAEGRELLPVIERQLRQMDQAKSTGISADAAIPAVARGIVRKLMLSQPPAWWHQPAAKRHADLAQLVTPALVAESLRQVERSLIFGELTVRSYELAEDLLVGPGQQKSVWQITGDGSAAFLPAQSGRSGDVLEYDLTPGKKISLSQTFETHFPVERLHSIKLYLRGDASWNHLDLTVEMSGHRLRAERAVSLADTRWLELAWQEPGPDDQSNKVRTWTLLREEARAPEFEHAPNRLKITVEIERVSLAAAWWDKVSQNYRLILNYIPFGRYVSTSLFLVILQLAGTLFSCSLTAYSFARLKWPGRRLCYFLMIATMIVPSQVTMIPHFVVMRSLGWYNTLYPLWIGSFFANAFFVFLLHQFLRGIPRDLEDAARIDGCGYWRIYWHVILPLIRPSLATIAILSFIGAWNDFTGPLVYLSDQRLYPLSFGLYALNIQSGGLMGIMLAGSLLMTLPVIVIFFFAQRYFIQGITLTGMK